MNISGDLVSMTVAHSCRLLLQTLCLHSTFYLHGSSTPLWPTTTTIQPLPLLMGDMVNHGWQEDMKAGGMQGGRGGQMFILAWRIFWYHRWRREEISMAITNTRRRNGIHL